uniref:Uncharacterized protein n=1 Tax=Ascaris lumbricoides TaxID=6252 RepID=A0A0M3HIB7_ASCLU
MCHEPSTSMLPSASSSSQERKCSLSTAMHGLPCVVDLALVMDGSLNVPSLAQVVQWVLFFSLMGQKWALIGSDSVE